MVDFYSTKRNKLMGFEVILFDFQNIYYICTFTLYLYLYIFHETAQLLVTESHILSQVGLLFGFLWSGSVKAYHCSFGIDAAEHEQGAGAWGLGPGRGVILPETKSLHLKRDGWKTILVLLGGLPYFQGRWLLVLGSVMFWCRCFYLFFARVETFLPLHFFGGCVGFQWIRLGGAPFLVVAGGAWVCKLF